MAPNVEVGILLKIQETGTADALNAILAAQQKATQAFKQGTLQSAMPGAKPGQLASRHEYASLLQDMKTEEARLRAEAKAHIKAVNAQLSSTVSGVYKAYSEGRLVKYPKGATQPVPVSEKEMLEYVGQLEAQAKRATRGYGRGSQSSIKETMRVLNEEVLDKTLVEGLEARKRIARQARRTPAAKEVPLRQGEIYERTPVKQSAAEKEFERQKKAQAVRYAAAQRLTEDPDAKAMRVGMRQEAALRRRTVAEELASNSEAGKEYRESQTEATRLNEKIRAMVQAGAAARLAGDKGYRADQVSLRTSNAKLSAGIAESLSTNASYLGAQAQAARARMREGAVVQNLLSGDAQYLTAQKNLVRSKARIAATTQEMLAGDSRYLGYQQRLTTAKAQQAASLQSALAADTRYLGAQARTASAKARQSAIIQETLASDATYLGAQVTLAKAKARQGGMVQETLASDGQYLAAQAQITRSKAIQSAAIQTSLAADNRYLGAQVQIASAKARQSAVVQETLSTDANYLGAQVTLAKAKARQSAMVQETLASDGQYLSSQAMITRSRAQQSAAVQSALASDNRYLGAQSQVASAKARQAAVIQSSLAADANYLGAQVTIAKAKAQQNAAVQSTLASDLQYQAAQVQITKAKAQQVAGVQGALSIDERYLSSQAALATAKARQNALIQGMLASDNEYAVAQAALARSKSAQNARVQESLSADTLYATNQAIVARAKAQQNARVQETLASDELYIAAQVMTARSKAEQQAALQAGKAGDDLYIVAQANAARSKAEEAAKLQMSLAATGEYAAFQAEAARGKAMEAAEEQRLLASDEEYIQATAMAARLRRENAARETLATAGYQNVTGMGGAEAIATAQLVKRSEADRERITMLRALNTQSTQEFQIGVERKIEEAKLNAAIRVREREYMRDAARTGQLGGTRFQRFYARVGIAAGRAPTDYPTMRQFVGQKAFQTLGYGVTGLATGAAFMGVADLLKDSSELEQVFVRLRGQLTALGQGAQFDEVRNGIKAIAVETGISAVDIEQFTSRLIGAYGGDIPRAIADTESATKLAVISGMDLKATYEATMPLAQAFAMSMGDIGDMAIEVSDRYGIASENFLKFGGRAGIVSKEAGLSFRELTIVSARMSLQLGKDMEASADTFNKMPDLIRRNQAAIFDILAQNPGSRKYAEQFRKDLQQNNPGKALIDVLRGVAAVPGAQTGIVKLIANRREAEEATALLSQSGLIVRDLNDAALLAGGSTGKLNARFASLSDTVTQTFKRIGRAFENLGETLYSSGVSEIFVTIGHSVEILAGLLGGLLNIFKAISELELDIPGPVDIEPGALGTWLRYGLIVAGVAKAFMMVNAARARRAASSGEESRDATARQNVGTAAQGAARGIQQETNAKQAGLPASQAAARTEASEAAARARVGAGATGAAGAVTFARGKRMGFPIAPQQIGAGLTGPFTPITPTNRRLGQAGLRIERSRAGAAEARLEAQAAGRGGIQTGIAAGAGAGAGLMSKRAMNALAGASLVADLMMVSQAISDQKAAVETQASAARDRLKKMTDEEVAQVASYESDIVSKFAAGVLKWDLPETLAKAEQMRKATAPAVAKMGAISRMPGLIGQALEGVSNENIENINSYISQSDLLREELAKAGGELGGPSILNRILSVTSIVGTAGLTKPLVDLVTENQGKAEADRAALEKVLPRFQQLAEQGNSEAQAMVATISNVLEGSDLSEAVKRAIDVAIKARSGNVAVEAAGGGEELVASKLGEMKKQFEAGDIEYGTYITEMNEQRAVLRETLRTATGEERTKGLIALAGFDEQLNKEMNDALDRRIERVGKMAELSGADDAAAKSAQARIGLLRGRDRKAQLAGASEAIDSLMKAFEEELENIGDPVKRFRRQAEGVKIPDWLRSLETQNMFRNVPQLAMGMESLARSFGMDLAEWEKSIADEMVATGKTVEKVVFSRIVEGRNKAVAALNAAPAQRRQEAIDKQNKEYEEELARWERVYGAGAPKGLKYERMSPGQQTSVTVPPRPVKPAEPPQQVVDEGAIRAIDERFMSQIQSWFDPQAMQTMTFLSGYFNQSTAGMTAMIMNRAEAEKISIKEAMERSLNERVDAAVRDAQGVGTPGGVEITEAEQKEIDKLKDVLPALDALFGAGSATAYAETVQKESIRKTKRGTADAETKADQAKIDLQASMQPRNQLVQAQADVDKAILARNKLLELALENADWVDPGELDAANAAINLALDKQAQRNEEIAMEGLKWARQRAGEDPVARTAADIAIAMRELANNRARWDEGQIGDAERAIADMWVTQGKNTEDIAMANLEFQQAQVEGDPVAAAMKAVEIAELAESMAKGDAAKKRAAINTLQARRNAAKAVSDVAAADAGLAIALAEARGDPVGAAQLQVNEIKRKLAEATANNDVLAMKQLTGELAGAEKNAFDTWLNTQTENIEFMREMGQITLSQTISMYEGLLATTQENSEEWKSLKRTIKRLKDEASGGAGGAGQFNLPTTLGLPTQYEARRMTQSMMQGIGYQDNRTVTMNVAINGAQDPNMVAQQLAVVFNASMSPASTPAMTASPRTGAYR